MNIRIAIVLGTFPTVSETFIVNQIIYLIKQGHKVDILALNKGNPSVIHKSISDNKLIEHTTYFKKIPRSFLKRLTFAITWILKNRKKVNWKNLLQAINVFKFGRIAFNLNLFYRNLWFLYRTPYDIVHVHFAQNAKNIAELKGKGFLKESKLVVSFHGYDIIPNNIDKLRVEYELILRIFDQIIANTRYTKNLVLKLQQVGYKTDVLPVGLDTKFFSSKKQTDSEIIRLVFCGRLVAYKGCKFLIEIIKELVFRNNNNVILNIIGEGPEKRIIERNARESNLLPYINILGPLNQNEIWKVFNNSDIFIFPGLTEPNSGRAENQGLVIQEAQAMQLPVIISDAGGMSEGILPNKSGIVIKEGNLDGFVTAIEKLIKSQRLRTEMGLNGKNFIVQNYDQEILGDKLIKIYESLLMIKC